MAALSFRTKLALFIATILVVSQIANMVNVFNATSGAIIDQAKSQLARTDDIANQYIRSRANQLAEFARVVSADYDLRRGLVQGEAGTKLSTLRNLAQRIRATRAVLIDMNGDVIADTQGAADGRAADGGDARRPFAFPSMLAAAAEGAPSTEIVVMDGGIYRFVVVPVLLPITASYVGLALPIDDALTHELRDISAVPIDISFAFDDHGKAFRVAASTMPAEMRHHVEPVLGDAPEARPEVIQIGGRQYVTIVRTVAVAKESAYVAAVLQYAIDDALVPFRQLVLSLVGLLAVVLIIALGVTVVLARGITRPIFSLVETARRIGGGDYNARAPNASGDEFGQLARAFNQMTDAIGEREERISHQANFDLLTDLPNRRQMERRLNAALDGAGDGPLAVALIGVNRLPEINNTLGHDLGDALIQRIGPKVAPLIGPDATLGRVADSVFAAILPGADAANARPLANAVVEAFEQPVPIDGALAVDASVHVGLSVAPDHGASARVLLQRADVALFNARSQPGRVAVYDPAEDPYKPENLSLMGELKDGIERGELQLHYQPKIGLAHGRLIGAEALVRWIHPRHGFLPPDRFIPLAEESGAIHRLTTWALATGIHQARRWRQGGLDLKIAVNLSVRDLLNRGLPDLVADHLKTAQVAADRLILEITESAIMADPDAALAVLKRLADLGVQLSVDDFGTGHSSFAYLRKLPISEIKVDKSFVLRLAQTPADQTIVRTIVDLGHNLDLKVTAEGVEDEASYDLLARFGCDVGQGYFMSRPLTIEKFEAFARESPYA